MSYVIATQQLPPEKLGVSCLNHQRGTPHSDPSTPLRSLGKHISHSPCALVDNRNDRARELIGVMSSRPGCMVDHVLCTCLAFSPLQSTQKQPKIKRSRLLAMKKVMPARSCQDWKLWKSTMVAGDVQPPESLFLFCPTPFK